MPRRQPILGYPSKTAAVVALTADGVATRDIAARLGISVAAVGALRGSDRKTAGKRTVVLPLEVLDRLQPFAARRKISVPELVRRLVETAVDDRMVDAILDDAEDAA